MRLNPRTETIVNAWVYMLECADGSFYVGSVRGSLETRIGQHQSGHFPGGYTSSRLPVRLVWSQDFQQITDAIAFERQLKGWSRAKKRALIEHDYDEISRNAQRRMPVKSATPSSFETRPSGAPQDEDFVDRLRLTLIVAAAENGVIGKDGTLPWHLPEDLKRFKALTIGKPCIMGRKTWDSLPRKPLPGRTNIVVTRNAGFHAEGARVAAGFEDALAIAAMEIPEEIMVIGGEAIFAAALPRADRILLTEVAAHIEGDARMPPLDASHWREISREGPHAQGALHYSYVTLERVR